MDWKDRNIVIIGAARQGIALARFLACRGARVILNDQKTADQLLAVRQSLNDLSEAGIEVEWVLGGHPLGLLDGADIVCPSGGVPLDLPLVREAQKRGIPLSNDSQIFIELAPCKVIGITGSAGKTTTTTLVGRIAQQAVEETASVPPYRKVWVGGNIGLPLISSLEEMHKDDLVVMELSSFQLEIMTRSPQVAAVLNVTPNHLDRHGTMEAYLAAKARIVEFQSPLNVAVLGRDNPEAWSLRSKTAGQILSFGLSEIADAQWGTYLKGNQIYLRREGDRPILSREDISLRGEHNLLNVMAACTIASAAGISEEAMRQAVIGFTGVPHRLEFVRRWGGADWYNDSIATAPERTMAAIRSFSEPLVLLVGGRDKNLPWSEFVELARQRVDHLIVFGEAAGKIMNAFESLGFGKMTVSRCVGLKDAVAMAAQVVEPGDVVLLSPGGTSFDEFTDFEERGRCFTKWVNELP